MKRIYILLIFTLFASLCIYAQELQANLTINTSKIQSIDQQAITQMESDLKTMLNERTWSNAKFERGERIDCSIGITLNAMPSENSYGAEVHITARRPVFNAAYETTLINYRDTKFDFNYMLGQSLDYNAVSLNSNLVGVMVFYINIIIGLDYDSFSLNGGQTYFTRAMEIANQAQSLGARGWEPFDGKSRYDLALALTEESSKNFHSLWYNYHRLGLDEMAGNPSRGRIRIMEIVKDLEAIYSARPNSILLPFFAETKLDELVKVCHESSAEEKRDLKNRLNKLFPGKKTVIETMTK